MRKRIFVALNIPSEIKRILLSHEKRWKNLKIRWTKFENLHITIEFIGNVDRKELENILLATEKVAEKLRHFDVFFDKITLGPNFLRPRMFWATVCVDVNLIKLKKQIDHNFCALGIKTENREFKPHITLARTKGNQLKGKQTNISLKGMKFKAESIEIMQSQLNPKGARYKIVESFNFSS